MTSNSSSTSTGHTYRIRPSTLTSSNTNSSSISNPNANTNSSYYGTSASNTTTPIVAPPTWTYSSPSQLARKYANIAPIWCHITKPRQLKKKFASTFHQAQSLVGFYNEDRAPSERRGSFGQSQQQQPPPLQQQQQSQQQSSTNYDPSNSYRQQYTSHYTPHDHITEPSSTSSSRSKKKYTGGALTTHISSRLQSPPPPPISPLTLEEKFSNPSERKARIDQLKDLVFNTRVKDTMIGRTDSKNRSITNLHKATSFKRLDQITSPTDEYQPTPIPPTTPTRKDSHYYHYHLPSSTVGSTLNDSLNRPILPTSSTTTTTTTTTPYPTYNYDYLRAKSKEHTRPTYHDSNYNNNSALANDLSTTQIGANSSSYVGSISGTNPSNSYRTYDDYSFITKPTSITDKNSSYSSVTSYPSYQTPGASKRRIKKYLLAKGGTGLSHQTEPIVSTFENISLADEDKTRDDDLTIVNTHALTPSTPPPSNTNSSTVVPSLNSTPPIPTIPALSPPPSPPLTSSNHTTVEPAVFSTPNAQLSPSPPLTNTINHKIPSAIFAPLSASLTSLNKQQQSVKSTANSLLELLPTHAGKEQSPSRSIVPSIADDGCAFLSVICVERVFVSTPTDLICMKRPLFFSSHVFAVLP